jgi:hypothetical protein
LSESSLPAPHPVIDDKIEAECGADELCVAGVAYGGYDNPKLTYSKSVKMWQGSNKISILSSAVGLAVSSRALIDTCFTSDHFVV